MRLRLPMLLVLLCLPMMSACADLIRTLAPETIKHEANRVSCGAFRIITYDRLGDTLPTIAQVKGHNAAYDSLKCPATADHAPLAIAPGSGLPPPAPSRTSP